MAGKDNYEGADSSTSLLGKPEVMKNKSPARFYFSLLIFIFFALLLDSVVSLGTLGMIHHKITKFLGYDGSTSVNRTCILFAKYDNTAPTYPTEVVLSGVGLCAFVLWGQVSIVIVAFVWLVHCICMFVFGPRL